MRRFFIFVLISVLWASALSAQGTRTKSGKCGDVEWSFDGRNLTFICSTSRLYSAAIPDYDLEKNVAPWVKQKLDVQRVVIGSGIIRIGSCAFANCANLKTVEFRDVYLREIGWGAFLNCKSLFTFSMPVNVRTIGAAAFANCTSLTSVRIPSLTRVDDMAFLSCSSLSVIELGINTQLGKAVFATEAQQSDGLTMHYYYDGEIRSLPRGVNSENCKEYGLAKTAVDRCLQKSHPYKEDIARVSDVDTGIPESRIMRNETYALIIGNENYKQAGYVPFAINDAKIFAEYCMHTLGVPATNIHVCTDATKHIIIEQELEDWLRDAIPNKQYKKLIVYYAGHGVPDTQDNNKAYLLPVDVLGAKPQRGIALDWFYAALGNLGFSQVTVFIDACFSGMSRDNQSVTEERTVEVEAQDAKPTTGNLVVFSAAQCNETAQNYRDEGHGLFTYYLLKELQESQGMVTYGDLSESIAKSVSRIASSLDNRKEQNPHTLSTVGDQWKELAF